MPIIRTFVSCAGIGPGIVVHGSKSPIGIVVFSKVNKYAMDLTGKRMTIDQYLQQVPGLVDVLETLLTDHILFNQSFLTKYVGHGD